jgi:hypothetical protein
MLQKIFTKNGNTLTKIKYDDFLKILTILILVFGTLVRLIQYLNNRSLWGDEASIALNIIHRSYLELVNNLDYQQAAPPGFLGMEKLAIEVFGDSEYSLRLFPLVSGIISLFAFYQLAKRYTSEIAATIAIALFACLRWTIYYSTEVKQYASDVMVAVLLYLLLITPADRSQKTQQTIISCLFLAISIWLSHPAILVIAGIELSYLLVAFISKSKTILLDRLPIYLTSLLSFSIFYLVVLTKSTDNQPLLDAWSGRFINSPLDVFSRLGGFFYRPLGFGAIVDGFAILASILGCFAGYRKNRINFIFIVSPFFVTLVASYWKKYPFYERLVLFLVPFALLIIGEGIVWLLTYFRSRSTKLFGTILLLIILIPPIIRASHIAIHPELNEEIRPVIEYIKFHHLPGDSIYVYAHGGTQFMYYAPKYNLTKDYQIGTVDAPPRRGGKIDREKWEVTKQKLESEISLWRGKKRVWFLFSTGQVQAEEKLLSEILLSNLNSIGGQQIDVFKQAKVFTYLYDLSRS